MVEFTEKFDSYVFIGDRIEAKLGDCVRVEAVIEFDQCAHIDDDDCHNTDQSVTGRDDEQQAELLEARTAWLNNKWCYVGVILSVWVGGVCIDDHAASLWGIECNYPGSYNEHLTEAANELLPEALATAREKVERIKAHLHKAESALKEVQS